MNICWRDKSGNVWLLQPEGDPDQNPRPGLTSAPWDGVLPPEAWRKPWGYDRGSLTELDHSRDARTRHAVDARKAKHMELLTLQAARSEAVSEGKAEEVAEIDRRLNG